MLAEVLRHQLLSDNSLSFCLNTVDSYPAKIDAVARAKALGDQSVMVFIHPQSSALNRARIAMRMNDGRLDVPSEKTTLQRLAAKHHFSVANAANQ